MELEDWIV